LSEGGEAQPVTKTSSTTAIKSLIVIKNNAGLNHLGLSPKHHPWHYFFDITIFRGLVNENLLPERETGPLLMASSTSIHAGNSPITHRIRRMPDTRTALFPQGESDAAIPRKNNRFANGRK
jgi:hypothetical protein